jgi:hypothetical protein
MKILFAAWRASGNSWQTFLHTDSTWNDPWYCVPAIKAPISVWDPCPLTCHHQPGTPPRVLPQLPKTCLESMAMVPSSWDFACRTKLGSVVHCAACQPLSANEIELFVQSVAHTLYVLVPSSNEVCGILECLFISAFAIKLQSLGVTTSMTCLFRR